MRPSEKELQTLEEIIRLSESLKASQSSADNFNSSSANDWLQNIYSAVQNLAGHYAPILALTRPEILDALHVIQEFVVDISTSVLFSDENRGYNINGRYNVNSRPAGRQIRELSESIYSTISEFTSPSARQSLPNFVLDHMPCNQSKSKSPDYYNTLEKGTQVSHKSDSRSRLDSCKQEFNRQRGHSDILLSLRPTASLDLRNEISVQLQKMLGTRVSAYSHIPYLRIQAGLGDEQSILRLFNQKRIVSDYFSADKREVLGNAETSQLYFSPKPILSRRARMRKSMMLWNLKNIGVYDAHAFTRGAGSIVLVLDTGADYNHNEIKHAFGDEKGYNFIAGNSNPLDGDGHGTHVSGTIAGIDTGVAPEAGLLAGKVLSDDGWGSEADILEGVEYGIDKGVDVISLSLDGEGYSRASELVFRAAYDQGIVVCAAAGNDHYGLGDDPYNYPASYEGVLSIAAVDINNEHADFSQVNDRVDISAPGVNIRSCLPGNRYADYSGTSMATPHVSGVMALARSLDSGLGNCDLEQMLLYTCKDIGDSANMFGHGLIQADQLVDLVKEAMEEVV
ncbi:S8 family peptidase [Candidatus Woesearchaeota archaeon]|nr:S8 family peptidase [Candidatus Woesearchaeota archaeon]